MYVRKLKEKVLIKWKDLEREKNICIINGREVVCTHSGIPEPYTEHTIKALGSCTQQFSGLCWARALSGLNEE
jgi:hypothetical protein